MSDSVYDYSFKSLDGINDIKLSDYKGKVILIVNTASECGFTPQYDGLQTLWQRYQNQGLIVLGVPCNDFGGQEPGDPFKIRSFCDSKYHVTFPMAQKVKVSGNDAHPFYKYAREKMGFFASPKWNFHKYLINKNGQIAEWYSTPTLPTADKVLKKIESLLAESTV